jgi:hypothetical protein
MVRKINVRVNQSTEVCDKYVNDMSKKLKNPLVVCPGVKPLNEPPCKTIYMKEFSKDALIAALGDKSTQAMIVKNIHKMQPETINNIISFATEFGLDVYFVGKAYNSKDCEYEAITYLSTLGHKPSWLESFTTAEEFPVAVAGEVPQKRGGNVDKACRAAEKLNRALRTFGLFGMSSRSKHGGK